MSTTSPNKLEISPSTVPAVKDTMKKSAKLSDKPITSRTKVQRIVNTFQHPLFDKENHPAKGANTLGELWDNINNNKYGFW